MDAVIQERRPVPLIEPESVATSGGSLAPKQVASSERIREIVFWTVLFAAPIAVSAAAAYFGAASMEPIFAARSEIVFQSQNEIDVSEQYRATQTLVATGRTVLAPVSRALDLPVEKLEKGLTVDFPRGGAVMRLQYADIDASEAIDVLSAIVDQYTIALGDMEGIDVVSHKLLVTPFVLEEPIWPRPLQAAAIGAALGLAISLGAIAFVQRARGRW